MAAVLGTFFGAGGVAPSPVLSKMRPTRTTEQIRGSGFRLFDRGWFLYFFGGYLTGLVNICVPLVLYETFVLVLVSIDQFFLLTQLHVTHYPHRQVGMLHKNSESMQHAWEDANYPDSGFSVVHDHLYGKICMMRAVVFLLQRIGLQTYSPSVDLSHACFPSRAVV